MHVSMTPPRDLYVVDPDADPRGEELAFQHASALPPLACIVGAPRCGTTTFARWLKRRPEVCFSKIKEPHFFTLVDLTDVQVAELPDIIENRYLNRFFPHRAPATKLLAEGSVSYL